jgi:hypothetical protein
MAAPAILLNARLKRESTVHNSNSFPKPNPGD